MKIKIIILCSLFSFSCTRAAKFTVDNKTGKTLFVRGYILVPSGDRAKQTKIFEIGKGESQNLKFSTKKNKTYYIYAHINPDRLIDSVPAPSMFGTTTLPLYQSRALNSKGDSVIFYPK